MNVPTNKLRDLVTVLSQLDQDAQHHVTSADTTVTRQGKRILHMQVAAAALKKAIFFEEFMDELYRKLDSEDCCICEDTATPADFYRTLTAHLSSLHADITALEQEVERLESTTSTSA